MITWLHSDKYGSKPTQGKTL